MNLLVIWLRIFLVMIQRLTRRLVLSNLQRSQVFLTGYDSLIEDLSIAQWDESRLHVYLKDADVQ